MTARSLEHPWHSLTHFLLRGWNIYITDGPRALLSAPRGGDSNYTGGRGTLLAWPPLLVCGCLGAYLTALCWFVGAWVPTWPACAGSWVPGHLLLVRGCLGAHPELRETVGLLRGVRPAESRSVWHHCDPLNETIPSFLGPSYPCPAACPVQSSAETERPPHPRTQCQHKRLVAQTWPVRFLFQCQ